MRKPKKVFVFGRKSPSNQPALPTLTQKELFNFGAESSPSQSTLTRHKMEVHPRESFPPCLPAELFQTALTVHRPAGTSGMSGKHRRRQHDRRIALGGIRVRAKAQQMVDFPA